MMPPYAAYKPYATTTQQVLPRKEVSSFIKQAQSFIHTILVNPESRNIYLFLCLRLAFMPVQMTYAFTSLCLFPRLKLSCCLSSFYHLGGHSMNGQLRDPDKESRLDQRF
jgi:hypothetical protein